MQSLLETFNDAIKRCVSGLNESKRAMSHQGSTLDTCKKDVMKDSLNLRKNVRFSGKLSSVFGDFSHSCLKCPTIVSMFIAFIFYTRLGNHAVLFSCIITCSYEQTTCYVCKGCGISAAGQSGSTVSQLLFIYHNFATMDRTLSFVILLCFVALCLAKNVHNSDENAGEPGAKLMMKRGAAKDDEEDAKVEVVQDGKDESAKEKKASDEHETKTKDDNDEKDHVSKKKSDDDDMTDDEDEHEEEDEDQHEEEEEEEVDPNAKIEIHDLYTPKDCVNKSKSGDLVVIHYKGWLEDGTLFDTTIDPNKGYMPFEFMLGTGTVIKGFERGVLDMCRGQKREIVIPPSLGYGKRGAGEIPGTKMLIKSLALSLLEAKFIVFVV